MKFLVVLLISLQAVSPLWAQATKQGWNNYAVHPELVWEDFKGKNPNINTTTAAEVNTSLELKWGYKTEGTEIEFIYEVYALQNPNASWVEVTQKTERVLSHEQLHFDITELHARIFRKWLSEFDYLNTRNLRRQVNRKYTEIKIAWKRMQQEYDLDTNHGILFKEQSLWNDKLEVLLEKYSNFKS